MTADTKSSLGNPVHAMNARILEQLVGDTAEPSLVLDAGRAIAERMIPALSDGLGAEFATPVDVEFQDAELVRFGDLQARQGKYGAMIIAASETSPDALVISTDARAIAVLVAALFGAEGDEELPTPEREPTTTETDIIAHVSELFARLVNGSGERSMGIRFPLPAVLSGRELAKRSLRDGPGISLRFRIALAGARSGTYGLVVLTLQQRVLLKYRTAEVEEPQEAETPSWRTRFGEEIMRSRINLIATVALGKMTLGQIAGMEVGKVIALPKNAQSTTKLSARGRTVFICDFGKIDQNFSVRISQNFDAGQEFVEGLLPG